MHGARFWLEKIRELPLPDHVRLMNVCGGHERSISMSGLRAALPAQIELIPGPGCPVCICPEQDIYQAMHLAMDKDVTLVSFGDMLRVPVNVPKNAIRSLEQAKAAGADVRPVASPSEAIKIAQAEPNKTVVFFAAGFETTTAPVAGMVAQGMPDNLLLLVSGRLTWPAVSMLLESEEPGFDALIAPGHVATVMGPEEWRFVVDKHRIPAAIAGFTPDSLLAAAYSVLRQLIENRPFLDNCYSEVVKPNGNQKAKALLESIMDIVDAPWRGIGVIPRSGYDLKPEFDQHNARLHFTDMASQARSHVGEMPPGCDCARVVLGKIKPLDCRIYGSPCTPRTPVGPCMVSDEGACRIWWASGLRKETDEIADAV
ncbi:hydrogenase formation protein HypD [Methylomonas sp. MgM2]